LQADEAAAGEAEGDAAVQEGAQPEAGEGAFVEWWNEYWDEERWAACVAGEEEDVEDGEDPGEEAPKNKL